MAEILSAWLSVGPFLHYTFQISHPLIPSAGLAGTSGDLPNQLWDRLYIQLTAPGVSVSLLPGPSSFQSTWALEGRGR